MKATEKDARRSDKKTGGGGPPVSWARSWGRTGSIAPIDFFAFDVDEDDVARGRSKSFFNQMVRLERIIDVADFRQFLALAGGEGEAGPFDGQRRDEDRVR